MQRLDILNRVESLLTEISTANGYLTDPTHVNYGDASPAEYDSGIELFYSMVSRSREIKNKSWHWTGMLAVSAVIYDVTPLLEANIEADIFRALGSDKSLSGTWRVNHPDGVEDTTEITIAGKKMAIAEWMFPVQYVTKQWET